MALDEALLESAAADPTGHATLRIYRWEKPTLSLGYFQSAADRRRHVPSRDCALIRRPSGGGAILHDDELTYALVLPERIATSRDSQVWYAKAHRLLIAAIDQLTRSEAALCENPPKLAPSDEPFLCFQRRAEGDLLLGMHKVAGSAQRRRRGAILQHGSVLLSRSCSAPELPGINDLSSNKLTFDDLSHQFTLLFAEHFSAQISLAEVTAKEHAAAQRLVREKYGAESWTFRR